MAGAELVIGFASDSNNSSRKLCSARGERITFEGAGGSFGEALGFTARPFAAQPEPISVKVSYNSSRDGLGRGAAFFMLFSDGGQGVGLPVFGGAHLGYLLHSGGTGAGLLQGLCAICTVAAPRPAGGEHASRPQGESCDGDQRPVHWRSSHMARSSARRRTRPRSSRPPALFHSSAHAPGQSLAKAKR